MKSISIKVFVVFILSLILVSCSSDDDNSSPDPDGGTVTIDLSGDLEGERTGMAFFQHIELPNNNESWELSFFDSSTFSADLSIISYGYNPSHTGVERPVPGTYPIGFDTENSDEIFFGIYTHFEDGDYANAEEYATFDSAGTLTIETSTEEWVTGNFEFTAHQDDDMGNIISTIHLNGEFEAGQRE